jgi:endonuclease/exonuclease/phosphatase (EEP) superfamily protein YafD
MLILKSRYSKVESLKIMGSASKRIMGPNINVLLWNVFKCKKKGWQEDFVSLVRNKNLILLQEAVLNSPFDLHFNESQRHQWIMARSFRNIKTNIVTGVKTGAIVAANNHHFSVSAHGEPLTQTKKMLLATQYPISPVQSLLVVNSHMINFVSFEKYKAHLKQVFQALCQHTVPILLAGDFNTWNGRRLEYFNHLAASFLLEEVQLCRKPKLSHMLQHLDHVYCRGIEVIDAHVHTNIHSSDHFPISLSLRTLN